MINFKFLNDDDNQPDYVLRDEYDGAAWLYGRRENLDQYRYEVVLEQYHGIHSFLNNFPARFIVTVLSITGPNGRIHTADTEYVDGWGFDITSDLIIIEWVRFFQ